MTNKPVKTVVFPGCRSRHAVPSRHQGEPEGNAADRRQAADPVRGRRGAVGGRRNAGVHHRQLQAGDRGSLRQQPGTRGRAAGAGQAGTAGRAARHPAELGVLRVHPPARAARPGSRRAVRAAGGRRCAVHGASGGRSDRRRGAVPEADGGRAHRLRRQRSRRAERAAAGHRQVRHRVAGTPGRRRGSARCRTSSRSRSRTRPPSTLAVVGPLSAERRRFSRTWRRSARARAARFSSPTASRG